MIKSKSFNQIKKNLNFLKMLYIYDKRIDEKNYYSLPPDLHRRDYRR
jgi:hypothetical protein